MKKNLLIALMIFLWLLVLTMLVLSLTIFKDNFIILIISLILFLVLCIVQRIIIFKMNKSEISKKAEKISKQKFNKK